MVVWHERCCPGWTAHRFSFVIFFLCLDGQEKNKRALAKGWPCVLAVGFGAAFSAGLGEGLSGWLFERMVIFQLLLKVFQVLCFVPFYSADAFKTGHVLRLSQPMFFDPVRQPGLS